MCASISGLLALAVKVTESTSENVSHARHEVTRPNGVLGNSAHLGLSQENVPNQVGRRRGLDGSGL